jgi:hypothetical protein
MGPHVASISFHSLLNLRYINDRWGRPRAASISFYSLLKLGYEGEVDFDRPSDLYILPFTTLNLMCVNERLNLTCMVGLQCHLASSLFDLVLNLRFV